MSFLHAAQCGENFLKNAVEWTKYLYVFDVLTEKCSYSEFFWSAFSNIWTEFRKIWSLLRDIHILEDTHISPYSVRMRENTDQKNYKYRHFSRSASINY